MKLTYTRVTGEMELEDTDTQGKSIKVRLDSSKRANEAVGEAKAKIKAEKSKRCMVMERGSGV